MKCFTTWLFIIFYLLVNAGACTRYTGGNLNTSSLTARTEANPTAILRTGLNPLWFQLTENGPVRLESIEDAVYSSAFVPWPYVLHVSFFHERGDELVMVINRDGFLKVVSETEGLVLYRFAGGDLWRQYTTGGFVFYDGRYVALLYLEDFFLISNLPLPQERTWSFNMESNTPFAFNIPALEDFPVNEKWSLDTLRTGHDGLIYYRAGRTDNQQSVKKMFRTDSLFQIGYEIPAAEFFNSIPVRNEINHSILPILPEGFVYTGMAFVGDSITAFWEEQEEFNIGAAGIVFIRK
jgi:hypothetical protein